MTIFNYLNNPNEMFLDKYLDKFEEGTDERKLIDIFCYGNLNDYLKISNSLPEMLQLPKDGEAMKKLIELSILSLCAEKTQIEFKDLMTECQIQNTQDLENYIIDLVGKNLLIAKIDENSQIIKITRCSSRCIPNDYNSLQAIIDRIQITRDRISSAIEESQQGIC